MPAIRDISWATTTVATGTTLTIPIPAYEQNDLLLAVITADTGTATWSSSGWTLLFSQTNTCQQTMMYKIAGVTEVDTTFTATVSESYNGCIISIRDINTTNPFGSPVVRTTTTQAAAAKYQMSTVTTNVANSLIIYAASNSGVGVPSLIEGPVQGILGADGIAESMGIGWGFMPTVGTTSASVTCSNVATGAGIKTTLQIAPPSGGATVIPTYTSEDLSVYLDPINGTTAYNGNTALAATSDTNFGTSFTTPVGTVTGVDATVASAADTGINSFHSTGQLTSASTTNMAGAELVFATGNRPNVSGKNVLVHAQVSTPITLQRLGSVKSRRGVWFGMRSGTSVYKIFQTLGSDSPGSAGRPIPMIINDQATTQVASAGTLAPTSILALGVWNSGKPTGTSVLQFSQMWVMDKTTVCGGNAAEPIEIPGIYDAVARGHERTSVLQQGASQLLCLQHLQFGNGTDATYLLLDSTAIEFPSQNNLTTKQISYHSIDNKIGLSYLASSTDTIIHRNSVISSPSKFFWRIESASSASATYDFGGLAVIGAGDVQLRNVTTFNGMAFNTCSSITQNSAVIQNTNFTASYLFSNTPNSISYCDFISSGTGHAIEITTPGIYTFTGNTFTGYGTTGTTNAAIYNNSGGSVTLNITGGGSSPTYRNGAGASTTVNSNVQVTLTNLQNPSEVRVFQAGTTTEVSGTGAESVTSGSHVFSVSSGLAVDITILSLGYQNARIKNFSTTADTSVPVSQVIDRQYQNN